MKQKLKKKETENYINSVKEDNNEDVEYKYYINTTYLYCENQYIHSVSSYEREEVY